MRATFEIVYLSKIKNRHNFPYQSNMHKLYVVYNNIFSRLKCEIRFENE